MSFPRYLAPVCLAFMAGRLGAATPAAPQLASSSPFLPAGSMDNGGAGTVAGPIELRGIMSTAEGIRYCIFDTAKKTSTWVGLNEQGYDFVVKAQDNRADSDSVTVFTQGRTLHLALRSAKVASAMAAAAPAPAAAPTPITQTVVVNPTPADEARRLEAVAAEVQRRRLLREQLLQGQAPPAAPGGAPAPAGMAVPPPADGLRRPQ